MTFQEARQRVESTFANAPRVLSDGVREIRVDAVPTDSEAEIEGAVINVRVPLAHHTKRHQGWLFGAWSR